MNQAKFTTFVHKKPLLFHCSILKLLAIFCCGKEPLKVKTVPHQRRLNFKPLLSFFTQITTKHYDRYMLILAPIIDFLICFEVYCHATSTNADCNYHSSIVVTLKLTIDRQNYFRTVCQYILCVMCAVLLRL
jgi:hypothetical protein